MHARSWWIVLVALAALGALAVELPVPSSTPPRLPRYDHVVVVVMENHSYAPVVGNPDAPYINSLVAIGANFEDSHALTHPSQPNYLALFAGEFHGVTDDACPIDIKGKPNLASRLIEAKLSFAGYSEDLPSTGYTGCNSALYRRKHNPWVDFDNVPASANLSFADFPSDFERLPTVSFVVPNLCNDMHDCAVPIGDAWLRKNIDAYARWAVSHRSLLILTFDEDDNSPNNQIPTVFVGHNVIAGRYSERIDHYRVLATMLAMYELPHLGLTRNAAPIATPFVPGPIEAR